MGIQIDNPNSQPAVTFDKLHLCQLVISQPTFDDDTQNPVYSVAITTRNYGVLDGVRHYDMSQLAPESVGLNDYLTEAMVRAGDGDLRLINALTAIQEAVAVIYATKTGKGATVV